MNASIFIYQPTQLTDLGEQPVQIGMPVENATRKIRSDAAQKGMLIYGYAQHFLRS